MLYGAVIIDSLFQKMHPEILKSEDDEETKWRKYDQFSGFKSGFVSFQT